MAGQRGTTASPMNRVRQLMLERGAQSKSKPRKNPRRFQARFRALGRYSLAAPHPELREAIDRAESLTAAARWILDRMPNLVAHDGDVAACARDLVAPLVDDAVRAALADSPPD